MRKLRIGESVLDREGQLLGFVERIVVDQDAHQITHLVVEGRAVELGHFHDEGPDLLGTDLDKKDLETMPAADEPPFGKPGENWEAPAGYRLESFLSIAGALFGQAPYQPPVHVDLRAEGVHEITEGSPVWAGDEQVGEVKEVLTDARGRIQTLVVRHGGILGKELAVPIAMVSEVVGNNVHLDLAPGEVDKLEHYTPQPGS
jgi:sporulation protein YlmC with PRC-barrel domain